MKNPEQNASFAEEIRGKEAEIAASQERIDTLVSQKDYLKKKIDQFGKTLGIETDTAAAREDVDTIVTSEGVAVSEDKKQEKSAKKQKNKKAETGTLKKSSATKNANAVGRMYQTKQVVTRTENELARMVKNTPVEVPLNASFPKGRKQFSGSTENTEDALGAEQNSAETQEEGTKKSKDWKLGRRLVQNEQKAKTEARLRTEKAAAKKSAQEKDRIAAKWKKGREIVAARTEKTEPSNIFMETIANREGMYPGVNPSRSEAASRAERKTARLFGDIAEKLSATVPDFEKMTEGQKLLVIQGLESTLYSRVKEDGRAAFQESLKHDGTLLGRGKSLWKRVWKNKNTAGHETEILKGLSADENGGLSAIIASEGADIAKRIRESGLDGYTTPEGKIITDYAGLSRMANTSEHFRTMAKEYNAAATALAAIPQEWGFTRVSGRATDRPGYNDATKEQQNVFKKAELAFAAAKDRYLEALSGYGAENGADSPKEFAAAQLMDSQSMIEAMRFLSAHPDAAKRLHAMENQSALLRGLKDTAAERGAFLAGGATARTTTIALFGSSIGVVAAPVIAGVVGYFRGKKRAEENLREKSMLARSGKHQKGELAIGMGNVVRHIERLNKYRTALENTTDPLERQQLLSELKVRTDFMERKLELGQVNFGAKEGRFARQYDFMRGLAEARVVIETELNDKTIMDLIEQSPDTSTRITTDAEGNITIVPPPTHNVRRLIDSLGNLSQEELVTAREKFVTKEAWKSAKYGAMFAVGGVAVRHFGQFMDWLKTDAPVSAPVSSAQETADEVQRQINAVRSGKGFTPSQETAAADNVSPKPFIETRAPQTTFTEEQTATVRKTFAPTPASQENVPTTAEVGGSTQEAAATSTAETIPSRTPAVLTETPLVENSVGEAEVPDGQGAGVTLEALTKAPGLKNLTEEQRAFFDRNPNKIAEDLKLFDSTTGESKIIPRGSRIGVDSEGTVYMTNPNGQEAISLGRVREDGAFDVNESADSSLVVNKEGGLVESIPRLEQSEPGFAVNERGELFTPTERAVPDASLEADATDSETLSADNYKFTHKELRHIERATHRDYDRELTKYFGDNYERSATARFILGKDARQFLETQPEDALTGPYGKFYQDIIDMANVYPVDPTGKTLDQYLSMLYEFRERDLAFNEDVLEATRERVVTKLQEFFGPKPWRSDAWHELGQADAYLVMTNGKEVLEPKYEKLYDTVEELMQTTGIGPGEPDEHMDFKTFLEKLYEADTRRVLHAETYTPQ